MSKKKGKGKGTRRKRYINESRRVCYYHIIAKIPDNTIGNYAYPLHNNHKQKLLDLLFWLEEVYFIEVVNYCCMSNHIHITIRCERDALKGVKMTEIARRHAIYSNRKTPLDGRPTGILRSGSIT